MIKEFTTQEGKTISYQEYALFAELMDDCFGWYASNNKTEVQTGFSSFSVSVQAPEGYFYVGLRLTHDGGYQKHVGKDVQTMQNYRIDITTAANMSAGIDGEGINSFARMATKLSRFVKELEGHTEYPVMQDVSVSPA